MPRILIIDTDAATRFSIKEMLWDFPYEVDDASNGKLALERMRRQPADLVITEIMMPGMEGVEIVLLLRRN